MKYEDIFKEILDLPPARSHDHRIIIREGTDLINVRPYRYPTFQKSVMEDLVTKMLSKGIIRPSKSPFSSPVVWVRKRQYLECPLFDGRQR